MRFPRQTKIFRGQVDAAPFACVFFLLVIFLLFNSSFIFTPGVPIELPSSADLPGTEGPTVVVALDESGQLYFDHQIISEVELQTRLRSLVNTAPEQLTLIVQADRRVLYEKVIRLGILAEAAGIKRALYATRPELTPTPSLP
ncbi:MAG TPA: biopolymer transporter ExbD [Verrucomicrobiae bacterium]|nr:biopolymer transporter ExbD [Verrucomicrobiae bacterium]